MVLVKKASVSVTRLRSSVNDIPSADDILDASYKLFVIGAENDISDFMGTSK